MIFIKFDKKAKYYISPRLQIFQKSNLDVTP